MAMALLGAGLLLIGFFGGLRVVRGSIEPIMALWAGVSAVAGGFLLWGGLFELSQQAGWLGEILANTLFK